MYDKKVREQVITPFERLERNDALPINGYHILWEAERGDSVRSQFIERLARHEYSRYLCAQTANRLAKSLETSEDNRTIADLIGVAADLARRADSIDAMVAVARKAGEFAYTRGDAYKVYSTIPAKVLMADPGTSSHTTTGTLNNLAMTLYTEALSRLDSEDRRTEIEGYARETLTGYIDYCKRNALDLPDEAIALAGRLGAQDSVAQFVYDMIDLGNYSGIAVNTSRKIGIEHLDSTVIAEKVTKQLGGFIASDSASSSDAAQIVNSMSLAVLAGASIDASLLYKATLKILPHSNDASHALITFYGEHNKGQNHDMDILYGSSSPMAEKS